jgi:hypothetical protein
LFFKHLGAIVRALRLMHVQRVSRALLRHCITQRM